MELIAITIGAAIMAFGYWVVRLLAANRAGSQSPDRRRDWRVGAALGLVILAVGVIVGLAVANGGGWGLGHEEWRLGWGLVGVLTVGLLGGLLAIRRYARTRARPDILRGAGMVWLVAATPVAAAVQNPLREMLCGHVPQSIDALVRGMLFYDLVRGIFTGRGVGGEDYLVCGTSSMQGLLAVLFALAVALVTALLGTVAYAMGSRMRRRLTKLVPTPEGGSPGASAPLRPC